MIANLRRYPRMWLYMLGFILIMSFVAAIAVGEEEEAEAYLLRRELLNDGQVGVAPARACLTRDGVTPRQDDSALVLTPRPERMDRSDEVFHVLGEPCRREEDEVRGLDRAVDAQLFDDFQALRVLEGHVVGF